MRTRGPATHGQRDHQLTSTDLSADVETTPGHKDPKGWQRRQIEREQQAVAAGAVLAQIEAHLGGLLTAARAPAPSDVLYETTAFVPAGGAWTRNFQVPFQAVAVANMDSRGDPLTIVSGPPQGAAPVFGPGIVHVPSSIWRVTPLRGNALTIYGTPPAAVVPATHASLAATSTATPLAVATGTKTTFNLKIGTTVKKFVVQSGTFATPPALAAALLFAKTTGTVALSTFLTISIVATKLVFTAKASGTVGNTYQLTGTGGATTLLASLGFPATKKFAGGATQVTPAVGVFDVVVFSRPRDPGTGSCATVAVLG